MGARNLVETGLSYRQTTQPDGIGSLESILELLKSLKIRALFGKSEDTKYRRKIWRMWGEGDQTSTEIISISMQWGKSTSGTCLSEGQPARRGKGQSEAGKSQPEIGGGGAFCPDVHCSWSKNYGGHYGWIAPILVVLDRCLKRQ